MGQLGKVVQDDRDAQPYRLLFLSDGALSDVFYTPGDVEFYERGERPFMGDHVVVLKSDKRKGQVGEVVQDDYDQQPYRL